MTDTMPSRTRLITTHFGRGFNDPKSRVRKGRDGLWHVYWRGDWIAATSHWDWAVEWAITGRVDSAGPVGVPAP